MFYKTQRFYP